MSALLHRRDPVTAVLVFWTVVGFGLTGYGLSEMYTFTCAVEAADGCGGPFGVVLLLWGVPIVVFSVGLLLGRAAYHRYRGRAPD